MTPADVFHRICTFFGNKNPFEKRDALFSNDNPPEVDKVQTAIRSSGVALIRDLVTGPQSYVDFTNKIGTDCGVHHKIKSGGRLAVLEDDDTVCTAETGNTALPWHEAEVVLRGESSRLQPGTELDYDLAMDSFHFSYRCPSIETSKWSGSPAFANYVLAQDPEDADPTC